MSAARTAPCRAVRRSTLRRCRRALLQPCPRLTARARPQTTYYAKVSARDVPKAVDILSDILQHSVLEAGAIERERGVILREMEEVEKEAEEVLFDHLHATAFQFTSLGRPILGSAANVRSITRDDLVAYIGTHYTAPRMVVVGAGAVEHEQLVKLPPPPSPTCPRAAARRRSYAPPARRRSRAARCACATTTARLRTWRWR